MKRTNTNKPVLIPCHSVGWLCWPQGQDIENSSVKLDSKICKSEKIKDKRKKIKGKA